MINDKISGADYEAAMIGADDLAWEISSGLAFGLDPYDIAGNLVGKYEIKGKENGVEPIISLRCAMVCAEPNFQSFLTDRSGLYVPNDESAAAHVCGYCVIDSLEDLNRPERARARELWASLNEKYESWLKS